MKIEILIKYIIVALVQGLGEILPISSSGHMVIAQILLKMESADLTFEIFLHFASLIAIIIFFYKKIIKLITSFFKYIFKKETRLDNETKNDFSLCINLVIATIPAAVIGLVLEALDLTKYLEKLWIVGIFLIITSAMLFISTKMKKTREISEMTYKDALVFGAFQAFGVLPGISRSGSCIVGGSTRKFKQSDAAEFAFLMALPIMLGSAIFKVGDIFVALQDTSLIIPYIVAFLVTLVVTYFCLKVFLKIIRKQKLTVFSIYCLTIGIVSIILGLTILK